MANGDQNKAPDFGPEEAQMAQLADELHKVMNKRAYRQLASISAIDNSAVLTGAITELLTNIQALDKSISKLTTAMYEINKRGMGTHKGTP